jgi:hypothetical protein
MSARPRGKKLLPIKYQLQVVQSASFFLFSSFFSFAMRLHAVCAMDMT